jgi:copper(I)-binding protein
VPEAPRGTARLVVSMRIIQISADDRLLSAHTPVGATLELRMPGWRPLPNPAPAASAASAAAATTPAGIPLRRGHELNFTPFGPHLVLHAVNTELRYGFEFPLTLRFENAGAVEAALIVGTH